MDGYSRTARVPSQYGQPSPFVTRARIGASHRCPLRHRHLTRRPELALTWLGSPALRPRVLSHSRARSG